MLRVPIDIDDAKDGQIFWIAPFNDIHYNTRECDKERYHRYIDWGVRQIRAGHKVLGIGLGDYNDPMSPSERASEAAAKGGYGKHETTLIWLDEKATELSDTFANVMMPWAKKKAVAMLLDGHHYMCFSSRYGVKDLKGASNTEYLARKLGAVYAGQLGFLHLHFTKQNLHYRVLASHGYGGARTVGARVQKRVRMNEVVAADLYLMGHDNTKCAYSDNVLEYTDDGKYIARKRTYCGTGSFQRSYPDGDPAGGYVEQLLLPPSDLGAVITSVKVEKRGGRWRLDAHTSV